MDSESTQLRDSGIPAEFVRRKNGTWNHQDWLEFLAQVRRAGYTTLSDPEVGRVLEEEKMRFGAARAAAGRSRAATSTREAKRRVSR